MKHRTQTNSIGIYENYLGDVRIRQSFLEFVPLAFSDASFDMWFAVNAWDGKYQALSAYHLSNPNRIVSNLSYSKMRILLEGKEFEGYQLATVGTLPDERKRGLSRLLMEHWSEKVPANNLVFLFANSSVLDFYPKFGFIPQQETQFTKKIVCNFNQGGRRLNLKNADDFNLLRKVIDNRVPVTNIFGAADYGHILLWHALYIVPNSFWWISELDTIVSCESKDSIFYLYDILWPRIYSFETLLNFLPIQNCERIELGFTPDLLDVKFEEQVLNAESPLFVRGDFSLQGKKFKFPVLAQT